jgi:hypothetical protein
LPGERLATTTCAVAPPHRPRRCWRATASPAAALAAALLAGCNPSPPPQPPLPQDAGAAIAALLQANHGPLRGVLDHSFVHAFPSDAPADAKPLALALDGQRLRVDRQDGAVEILGRQGGWRCLANQPPQALDEGGLRELRALRDLLGAAYLLPLYGARTVERRGPSVFAIVAADGSTWRLEIDLTKHRPKSLSGPPGEVVFHDFLESAVSQLPQRVGLGKHGELRLKLLAADALFEEYLFQDPSRPATVAALGAKLTRRDGDARPTEPLLETIESTLFLVIDDPLDWDKRAAAITTIGETLAEQGQFGQGLPFLFTEAERPRIGIPFVPDETTGSRPFLARTGQDARARPRHTAIVVYGADASFAVGSAALARAAQGFAERHRHTLAGPLRTLPYLAWEDGGPSEARLQRLGVRVELPIAEPPR